MKNKNPQDEKNGIMKNIPEPLGFENLLKNHGILLEHQTRDKLCKYFLDKGMHVLESKVGKFFESVETDVFISVTHKEKSVETINNLDLILDNKCACNHPVKPYSLHRYFLIQCKGHPSDGFLLCRKNDNNPDIIYEQVLEDNINRNNTLFVVPRHKVQIVDWAYFYKINEGKTNNNKTVYQEDKGKFYTAVEQINKSFDNFKNVFPENLSLETKVLFKSISINYIISPIIVTNCPICMMTIKPDKVEYNTVPWVTYSNNDKTMPYRFKIPLYIKVVNYHYLDIFIRYFTNINEAEEKYPTDTTSEIACFNLS